MSALTLGVVIDIPEPHSTVLTGWRRRAGDPHADTIWPHVTLLPPTEIVAEDLPAVEAHLAAAAAQCPPFSMHLSGTGTFRPTSPVVFVQLARGASECEVLEKAIRRGPLQRALDFPYHPHVTVAHDVDEASLDRVYDDLADFIARFHVSSFTLSERRSAGWVPRRHFPLGGTSTV